MKHYLNPEITAQNILKNDAIAIGENCLLVTKTLPPHQTLLTVKQSNTLCFSTVPQEFKWMLAFLEGVTIKSQAHQLNKKMTLQSQLLLFYLIYLKTNFADHQLYGPWLNRPINGLYHFHRTVIEQTENLDLLISYVAIQNHLNLLTQQLFVLLSKPFHLSVLQLLMNSQEPHLNQFRNLYIWSYQFINSRSFGYTEQYTLIPLFDMVNHSSRNDNAQLIITAKPFHTREQIASIIADYEHKQEDFNSDNDSEEEAQNITKVNAKFMDLYYHLVTIDNIHAEEEILLKYGQRNNMFLLQGYGFVQEYNKFDSLTVFFSTISDEIYYDSVRGAISIKCKFKRDGLDFSIILNLKRYYYDKYYSKSHTKAKIIWSIPKDIQFQKYYLSQILKRMTKYRPKVHYFSNLKGNQELTIWQKERKCIFQANIKFIVYLCRQLLGSSKSLFEHQIMQQIENTKQDFNLPQSILEYGQLLRKINE